MSPEWTSSHEMMNDNYMPPNHIPGLDRGRRLHGKRAANEGVNALLLTLLLTTMAQSQQPETISTGTLSLQQVLAAVRRDNPEALAARRRWEASRERIVQSATPAQPRLGVEGMYAASLSRAVTEPEEKTVTITQELPFPTVLHLRHGLAAKDAAMLEQSYRAKLLEVGARARTAYAMLFLAGKGISIYDESIGIMRRFSRVAESKISAGRGAQSDALKAQVELTRMLNMRVTMEQEVETSGAMLNALLGREARAALGVPQEPAPAAALLDGDALEAAAVSDRPELREALLAAERAEGSLSLARSEYLPELMFQGRRRSDPMRGKTYDAMVGLSFPLWFWKPAAMVREARAERDMAQAEASAARLSTQAELRAARSRARTAQRLLEAYRTTLLPQAEESLKVAESAYQSDRAGFLDLLDAERSLLAFRLEYYQTMAEYETRLAELQRIVGREL